MSSFAIQGLSGAMVENLASLGMTVPTPIQQAALPHVLAGRDVIGMARTGSGKTAAFGIGLIETLDAARFRVQSLVLCPTRELADQVARSLRQLARAVHNVKVLTLCGGVPVGPQIGSLAHGAHIIVGTPGRVLDHLEKETLNLDHLKTLVLDEADRMLDMGFQEAMEAIIGRCPEQRQTLLFSATWPRDIRKLSGSIQRAPAEVTVEEEAGADEVPEIEQVFYELESGQELKALVGLLSREQPERCLVFCTTKQDCDDVVAGLAERGFDSLPLHGGLEQKDRDQTLIAFMNHSCRILVATDVAARGLDIEALPLVVNLEPARDTDTHVHRVGRTGRAGESGKAVTFVTPAKAHVLVRLEQALGREIHPEDGRALPGEKTEPLVPAMKTLVIAGGKKDKIRPGDILGALTGEAGLPGQAVGRIVLQEFQSFVAIRADLAEVALRRLEAGKIKGRRLRVRLV